MSQWQPATRRQWYRLGIVAVALALVGVGALTVATTTADAQADLQVGEFAVGDVNRTLDGNVTGLTLTADVDYQHSVPDAARRVVTVSAGATNDTLQPVAYRNTRDPTGTASGTLELSGNVLAATALSPDDIQPAAGASKTTTLIVEARIEVTRASGETVTETVRERVTLTLHDDATITATVGGSGTLTVRTDG